MSPSPAIRLSAVKRPVNATVRLPGSKSLTNRALLMAAMAHGDSIIDGVLLADDTDCMLKALQNLGIRLKVDRESNRTTVSGAGGYWPESEASLFCGNAGTVMRFLTAACAAGHGEYQLDGSARMRERPIRQLVDALQDLGARIGYERVEGQCPITIEAKGLHGGHVVFKELPSSQFVSAILMAAPLARKDVTLEVTGRLPSGSYVLTTLAAMEAFGISVVEQDMKRFIVPAPQQYKSTHYYVEPDATAASYFFAAAAVTGGRVTVEGLGSNSRQGDIHFVDILEQMGCRTERKPSETTVCGPPRQKLLGVDADLNEMPDVAQTLAVLAAFANGPSRLRNLETLRHKETDRLQALANELTRMGARIVVNDQELVIEPRQPLLPCEIETYDDHRMAMSFAVAGLVLDGVVIKDPACVNKTYPGFFQDWEAMQAGAEGA